VTCSTAPQALVKAPIVAIYLCRNETMLETALRLRYEVCYQELGRDSPYADHVKKIITDNLDDFGHIFIAIEDGETIGTLRLNLSIEGSLGVLEELYGMRTSAFHPASTLFAPGLSSSTRSASARPPSH